jgi:hypothetical protein
MANVMERIGNWFLAGRRRAEIERIDPSEASRIAGEIGVSVRELGELAAEGPDSDAPLRRRLDILHLDIGALTRREPATVRDMQRVCSHCADRGRCKHDLATDPEGADWETYCPNVDTIKDFARQ